MKKNNYPKIILKKDIKQDAHNAIDFIIGEEEIEYKNWFLPEELRFLLNGKFSKKEIKKILEEYTKIYYYLHQKEIDKGFSEAVRNWKKIEKKYFLLVGKIFKNHPWPKGKYTGFASVFRMFPRWIEPKIFYFPYQDTLGATAPRVIAHEALHFMFFSYIKKKYNLTEASKIKGRGDSYVWEVSEVFNTIMEKWDPYKKIIKNFSKPYPGMEKMYTKMSKQWKQKQDIDWVLDHWF